MKHQMKRHMAYYLWENGREQIFASVLNSSRSITKEAFSKFMDNLFDVYCIWQQTASKIGVEDFVITIVLPNINYYILNLWQMEE